MLHRIVVYLPEKLYELAIRFRLTLYKIGFLKSKSLVNPVISVGNITTGGTGKTPIVEFISHYLASNKYRPSILTRGYGRSNSNKNCVLVSDGNKICSSIEDAGDEPLMMAQKLQGVKIVVGKNRYANGSWLEKNFDCDVHILDDGFQHIQLKRNLNLLLIDATNPFGGEKLIPSGMLREPISEMKRADAILVTRYNHSFDQDRFQKILNKFQISVPIFYSYNQVTQIYDLKTKISKPIDWFQNKLIGIFCGLGNPQIFSQDLRSIGLNISWIQKFRDHYTYTQVDIDQLVEKCFASNIKILMTTQKDAVKLQFFNIKNISIYVVEITVQIEEEILFKKLLMEVFSKS